MNNSQVKKLPKRLVIGNYQIISQDPSAFVGVASQIPSYLEDFIKFWAMLEAATKHRWKCTSWLRNSPSHRHGYAMDFAPDISPSSEVHYAVTHMSDPVLYKRTKLILQLRKLTPKAELFKHSIGIYIEPDHLHVHLMNPHPTRQIKIFKWKQPKPIYGDTVTRMKLPMIDTGL